MKKVRIISEKKPGELRKHLLRIRRAALIFMPRSSADYDCRARVASIREAWAMKHHNDQEIEVRNVVKMLESAQEIMRKKRQDPDVFLDSPLWVSWMMIIDSVQMFTDLTGRSPKRIHLPRTVELLVDAYVAKHIGVGEPLRRYSRLLGLDVVFDAPRFKLD